MTAPQTSWHDLWTVFGRIGLLSFGGPAAQIALMHRELVEERRWLTEEQFLRGLSFCTLLPGPEAMQLATHAGWRLRGTLGGLLAGILFVLPGAAVVMALAAAYLALGGVPSVRAAFLGVQAAVLAIVAQALVRLARRSLPGSIERLTAAGAFVALFAFGLPFWAVLVVAGGFGLLRPDLGAEAEPAVPAPLADTLRTVAIWGLLWWSPLLAIVALAPGSPPAQAAILFSWLAIVSFGGAYAVLAALSQMAVEGHGWLTTQQMIDGLGLAETTPGPLILVTVFVGWLGGDGGGWTLSLATALVTLWATFVPCFLWVFAGSPHLERLTAQPRLRGAMRSIQAAVVGVMAALGLWFALHVLFERFAPGDVLPDLASLHPSALALAGLAAILLGPLARGVPLTLLICAVTALALDAAA